jgi:membrane-associated phospholipid phosphatase
VDPYCLFDTSLIGVFASSYSIPPPHPLTSPEAGAELIELYAMSLLRDVDIRVFQDVNQGPSNVTTSDFVNNILAALNQPNIKNYMGAPLDSSGNITLANIFRGNTEGDLYGPYISQFLYYNVGMGSCFYRQLYRCYSNQRLEYIYGRKYPPPNADFGEYPVISAEIFFDISDDYKYAYAGSPWIYLNDYNRGLTGTSSNGGFYNTWNGGNNDIITGGDQYGVSPFYPNSIPATTTPVRYISTLRDGAFYVLRDQIWQPFFTAATILFGCPRFDATQPGGVSRTAFGCPIGFQVDGRVGQKFINLGPVDLFALLSMAGKNSMNACWLWKWSLMYPRPEEMAYQVHIKKKTGLGIDFSSNILDSTILTDVSNCNFGNFLLPQAYINGSPNHPSYPSGHATYAGAMATILKAWFNCDSSMNAYVGDSIRSTGTSQGGATTEPIQTIFYKTGIAGVTGIFLKVEHEIDKLASNCAILRNAGGVHYRQDSNSGLKLGEDVAIKTLEDWVQTYNNNIIFRFRLRSGIVYEVSKTYSGPYLGTLPFYANTPVRLTNGSNEAITAIQKEVNAPYAFINTYSLTETVFTDPNLF